MTMGHSRQHPENLSSLTGTNSKRLGPPSVRSGFLSGPGTDLYISKLDVSGLHITIQVDG